MLFRTSSKARQDLGINTNMHGKTTLMNKSTDCYLLRHVSMEMTSELISLFIPLSVSE